MARFSSNRPCAQRHYDHHTTSRHATRLVHSSATAYSDYCRFSTRIYRLRHTYDAFRQNVQPPTKYEHSAPRPLQRRTFEWQPFPNGVERPYWHKAVDKPCRSSTIRWQRTHCRAWCFNGSCYYHDAFRWQRCIALSNGLHWGLWLHFGCWTV